MSWYRKKPVKVEAFRVPLTYAEYVRWAQHPTDVPDWFLSKVGEPEVVPGRIFRHKNGLFVIATLEGLMEISPGDYVIRGPLGEIYPCKPAQFTATYEPAEAHE